MRNWTNTLMKELARAWGSRSLHWMKLLSIISAVISLLGGGFIPAGNAASTNIKATGNPDSRPHEARKKDGWLSVVDIPGVDPSGLKDSSDGINSAINEGFRKLIFPCGVFLIEGSIYVESNTTLVGDEKCTILRTSASMRPLRQTVAGALGGVRAAISNSDYINGDSNIDINGFIIDSKTHQLNVSVINGLVFDKAEHVKISNIHYLGGANSHSGNMAEFIESGYFSMKNSVSEGTGSEGCIDAWSGSHDFLWSNNICDGGGITQRGLTVNGLSSWRSGNAIGKVSYNGIIRDNVVKNFKNVCFYIMGLRNPLSSGASGVVRSVKLINNTCTNVRGGAGMHGIIVGDAESITIEKNTIRNIGASCIRVASDGTSPTSDVIIRQNSCHGAAEENSSAAPYQVGNGADAPDLVEITNNSLTIEGEPKFDYAIRVSRGATNIHIHLGGEASGFKGLVFDASKRALISGP